jgi:hypothetical protein
MCVRCVIRPRQIINFGLKKTRFEALIENYLLLEPNIALRIYEKEIYIKKHLVEF